MRTKGVLYASLALMLFSARICEAQWYGTGSSNPGQIEPGYDYPPPGVEQAPEPSVPEPSTASLLLFGLTAALAFRRRS